MANTTLEHLLTIEAEAQALVNEAQNEADILLHDNEEKNRVLYEERIKAEIKSRESSLDSEKEKIKARYDKELENYRSELSALKSDDKKFSALLNE